MKTMNILAAWLLLLTLSRPLSMSYAQGTAFTYQGRLNDGGQPANGIYDFAFQVIDVPCNPTNGGVVVGAANLVNAVGITNGLFTATLDFGAGVFTGSDRWLEITVRTNGGTYYSLCPRQKLTATPYAITASNLTGTLPAVQLSGALASAQLSGTYSGAVTLNNAGNTFTGNGAGLANVNALTLAGYGYCNLPCYWNLTGNAGTTPGLNFVGTSDNQALEFKVNGVRTARFEPNASNLPNVIEGAPNNSVSAGVIAATIGGGQFNQVGGGNGTIGGGQFNTVIGTGAVVGGGRGNRATNFFATVAGGDGNVAEGDRSTVGGGSANTARSYLSTVAGGFGNSATGTGSFIGGGGEGTGANNAASGNASVIGGGIHNSVAGNNSAINGGQSNVIQAAAPMSFIGGGSNNLMLGGIFSTIGGGANNIANGVGATISGGGGNLYPESLPSLGGYVNVGGNQVAADFSVVGGGGNNVISNASIFAVIAGGVLNTIQTNAVGSAIGGGLFNAIQTNSTASKIGGGVFNVVTGSGDVIGGGGIDGGALSPGLLGNAISANAAVIGGGLGNTIVAGSDYSTIAGGLVNSVGLVSGIFSASALCASIGGGQLNTNIGFCAMIPGGLRNYASGSYSLAGGNRARAVHQGAFIWSDSTAADFSSAANNEFAARVNGGVRFTSGSGGVNQTVSWTPGSGSWSFTSDRDTKENFKRLDAQAVLDKVAQIPVSEWNYKGYGDRHVGPMAQDFHAAFPFNDNDKMLNSADVAGVSLVAIQGLNQKVEAKDARIAELEKRLEKLERLLINKTGGNK